MWCISVLNLTVVSSRWMYRLRYRVATTCSVLLQWESARSRLNNWGSKTKETRTSYHVTLLEGVYLLKAQKKALPNEFSQRTRLKYINQVDTMRLYMTLWAITSLYWYNKHDLSCETEPELNKTHVPPPAPHWNTDNITHSIHWRFTLYHNCGFNRGVSFSQ